MNEGVGVVNSQHKFPTSSADNWVSSTGDKSLSLSL